MKRKVRTTDVAQKTSYEAAQEEISIDLKKERRLHHTRCLGRKGAHAGPRNTAFSLSGENIFIPLDFSFDESLGILSF